MAVRLLLFLHSIPPKLCRIGIRREYEGMAGDSLGALSMKKGPRNEFLSPFFGVLFE